MGKISFGVRNNRAFRALNFLILNGHKMNVEASQTKELLVKTNKWIFVKPFLKPKTYTNGVW